MECGLVCDDYLLLFPLQQAYFIQEFDGAWSWMCGVNQEFQDSDSPVFPSLDPIFSVSFFSGSTSSNRTSSNKECPFKMGMYFCQVTFNICWRSLSTSVVDGMRIPGLSQACIRHADKWHTSASPFHIPSLPPPLGVPLKIDQNPFIIALLVDMASLLEFA